MDDCADLCGLRSQERKRVSLRRRDLVLYPDPPKEEENSASKSVIISDHTHLDKMISNTRDTSLNEDKRNLGREEPKGKIEKVSNTEGTKVKDGFLWKIISKISIEPAVILMNLGWTMYWVQTSNLYIEKTCKVGSFFFGNGTTFTNEVFFS